MEEITNKEKKSIDIAEDKFKKLDKYSNEQLTYIPNKITRDCLREMTLDAKESLYNILLNNTKKITSESLQEPKNKLLFYNNSFRFEDDTSKKILKPILLDFEKEGLSTSDIFLQVIESAKVAREDSDFKLWAKETSKPMPKSTPFYNGDWNSHQDEYIVTESIFKSYGVEIEEEEIKKAFEEKQNNLALVSK